MIIQERSIPSRREPCAPRLLALPLLALLHSMEADAQAAVSEHRSRGPGTTQSIVGAPAPESSTVASRMPRPSRGQGGADAGRLPAVHVTAKRLPGSTQEGGGYGTATATVAGKTAMRLRETPQSLSVLTRQRLDDQQLTSTADALAWVPGVVNWRQSDTEAPRLYARGFTLDNFMIDGSLVGAGFWQLPADLSLYDSVEVLRGPAGLFAGSGSSGSPGGAVNLVRKRPTSQPLHSATLALGSWAQRRATMDVSGPLSEGGRWRGRAIASHLDRRFHFDYARRKVDSLYGVLAGDLTPRTTLSLGLDYERRRAVPGSSGLPLRGDGSDPRWPRNKSTVLPWGRWNGHTYGAFAELVHSFGEDWQFKSSYTYRREQLFWDWAYVTGVVEPIPGTRQRGTYIGSQRRDEDERQHAFDARLDGRFQALGRTHELALGLDLLRRERWALYPVGYGYSSNPVDVDFARFDPALYPWRPSQSDPALYSTYGPTRQGGIYVHARLRLLDPLALTAGSRLSRYQYGGFHRPGLGIRGSGAYRKNDVLTPFAALSWDFDGATTAYLSHAEIFRVQNRYDMQGRMLAPEQGSNIELGLKREFHDGRLNASAAAYQLDLDHQARVDPASPYPCPASPALGYCYIGDNAQRTRGLDLELTGALSQDWQASLGLTWLRKTYTRSLDRKGSPSADQGRAWDQDQPNRMLKAWSSYRLPGAASAWQLGGGLLMQSEIYAERTAQGAVPAARTRQGGYALWSAMAAWDIHPGLQAQLNVDNLFDKRYYSQVGTTQVVYGAPRSLMLSLTARF